jgi:hypothetical protein
MDYGMFEEALVDFFCRQSHDPAVARSRAAAVIAIAKSCDEEIVGMTLDCSPIPLVEECDVALETIAEFLREKQEGGRS